MQLYNTTTNTFFDVAFTWPSSGARCDIADLDLWNGQQLRKLRDEFADVLEARKIPEDQREAAILENPDLIERSLEYNARVVRVQNTVRLRLCQLALTTHGHSAEERELLNSDVDSEFWKKQPTPVTVDIGRAFRRANSEGRSTDTADSGVGNSASTPTTGATEQPGDGKEAPVSGDTDS